MIDEEGGGMHCTYQASHYQQPLLNFAEALYKQCTSSASHESLPSKQLFMSAGMPAVYCSDASCSHDGAFGEADRVIATKVQSLS